jgi:hypothetical protein
LRFFTTKKEYSSLNIIIGLLPGANMLIGLRLFSSSNNQIPAAPYFLQGIIAVAFGIVFFSKTWANLPIQTEHEFISLRYRDPFVKLLSVFRSLFLGIIIIPLLLAISAQTLIEIIGYFKIPRNEIIIALFGILFIGVFFNDLKNRIKIDMIIGALTLIAIVIYFIHNIFIQHQNNALQNEIKQTLFSTSLKNMYTSLFFLWWFTMIVDMPDMRSQKLLSLKNNQHGRAVILIASGISIFIQGLFLAYPFYLVDYALWCWIDIVFFVLIIFNVIQSMLSLNHWAGSLITSGISELYPNFKNKTVFSIPILIFNFCLCLIWLFINHSASSLVFDLVSFTAGVGPLYILRWIWPKVNSLANFMAMVFAPIYFLLWKWLVSYQSIQIALNRIIDEPYLQTITIVGLLNMATWLIIIFLSASKKQENAAQSIINKYEMDVAFRKPINWLYFVLICVVFICLMFGPILLRGN